MLLALLLIVQGVHGRGTSEVAQLEVVTDLLLEHEDIGNPSPPKRHHNGLHQPYPTELDVAFNAFGMTFKYHMTLMHNLYGAESEMHMHSADGVDNAPHQLISYWDYDATSRSGSAALTLLENGLFTLVAHRDGEIFQVGPVDDHAEHLDLEDLQELHKLAIHGVVVHRASDILGLDKATCGTVKEHHLDPSTSVNHSSVSAQQIQSHTRKLMALEPWTGCTNAANTARAISHGAIVDFGLFKKLGSDVTAVHETISQTYASINLIYMRQMNVFIQIKATKIYTTATADSWNQDRATGCSSINSALDSLGSFRATDEGKKWGSWHLLTDCYPPPGTVGLAWVGSLCGRSSTGVSTYHSGFWGTVAHEIGHNFAGGHSFENGQGSTGGIMDYGDGIYLGEYQFNTEFRRQQMCAHVGSKQSAQTPDGGPCWTDYVTTCGNGLLEAGEECDETHSGCCTNQCTLAPGAFCSGENECCVGCQLTPSYTTCRGLFEHRGFCSSGECLVSSSPSECDDWRPDTAGCQFKCGNNGAWQNMEDGTVCEVEPYSVCQATSPTSSECQEVPSSWSWFTGDWGMCEARANDAGFECSKSGNGFRLRVVNCQDNLGRPVALADETTLCSGARPDDRVDCTACAPGTQDDPTAPCIRKCLGYEWLLGAWGDCDSDCKGISVTGKQSATLHCHELSDPLEQVQADELCTSTPPATVQDCNLTPCPAEWVYGEWEDCTVPCGPGGVRSRSSTCEETRNLATSPVADNACSAPQDRTETCNDGVVCDAYEFFYSVWSSCTVSCGGGTRERSIVCKDTASGNFVAESSCTKTKPLSSGTCNTVACPSYTWEVASDWSTCSEVCGGGQQSRTLQCRDEVTDKIVSNLLCTKAAPLSRQACNEDPCAEYAWRPGLWGECSESCGGGTQTRSVVCVNLVDGQSGTVDATGTACPGTPPSTTGPCNEQACVSYGWFAQPFTKCSVTCGGGTKTRKVVCIELGNSKIVGDSQCSGATYAPTENCNVQECPSPDDNKWSVSEWGACSAKCGPGTRKRTVECLGSVCPEALKPLEEDTCTIIPCASYWRVGIWNTCSEPCGAGDTTRSVVCVTGGTGIDGKADDLDLNNYCTAPKPSTDATCNAFRCPVWLGGEWSPCSAPCGPGNQTRSVTCVDHVDNPSPDTTCSASFPAATRVCNTVSCPHWHRSPWSDCDLPCGGGSQARQLVCRYPHDPNFLGRAVPETEQDLCPAEQPFAEQECNAGACTEYFWKVSYGPCSRVCGGGQRLAVTTRCMETPTTEAPRQDLCIGDPPAQTVSCNEQPCGQYAWLLINEEYGNCTAECGGGTQTREVVCIDNSIKDDPTRTEDYEILDDSVCAQEFQIPNPYPKTQECNTGMTCGTHGRCADKVCTCRPGWTSYQCKDKPLVHSVVTDADRFTEGVPMGELVTIQWNTTNDMSVVSIALISGLGTEYISSETDADSGVYLWQVPELPQRTDYKVRVWFSKYAKADSKAFSTASPCGYKSCGRSGTCDAKSGVCKCEPGYTGINCAISPCNAIGCGSNSVCDNSAKKPECTCTNDYTGDTCRIPPGCSASRCANGGFPVATIEAANGTCDSCVCAEGTLFTPSSNCKTCGLVCQNEAKPKSNCEACSCKNGFFGNMCHCRYLPVTFYMHSGPPSKSAQFQRLLSQDLATAIRVDAERLPVHRIEHRKEDGQDKLWVTVRVTDDCQEFAFERSWLGQGLEKRTQRALLSASQPSHSAKRFSLQAAGVADDDRTVEHLRDDLLEMLKNSYSEAYMGLVSGAIVPSSARAGNIPEVKGMTAGEIVGVVFGVLFGIVLIGGCVFCCFTRREQIHSKVTNMRMAKMGTTEKKTCS